MVSFRPRSLQPPGKYLQYPLNKGLLKLQSEFGRYGENKNLFLLLGMYHESSVYHTLAYHYTDCAILAPTL